MAIKKCSTPYIVINKDKFNRFNDKMKPRMVSNQEGENDEDMTGSDTNMTILFFNKSKVNSIYIRYAFYIFEQVMWHHNLLLFTFAEVLAWIKEIIFGST